MERVQQCQRHQAALLLQVEHKQVQRAGDDGHEDDNHENDHNDDYGDDLCDSDHTDHDDHHSIKQA